MKRTLLFLAVLAASPIAAAGEFVHFGDFLLQAHFKVTGERKIPIPMKPLAFRVFSDGVQVRISAAGDDEARTTFEIYCSDGISRQRAQDGAIEVIPGIQATSNSGGILRHLRLSRESFTLTTFPSVSDQTVVSYAVAAIGRDEPTADAATSVTRP